MALQSVGSKSCHLFEESFTADWNIFFVEVVLMVPNRLNLGKLKSFTVRIPGKNTGQGPFLHSFKGIWEARGGTRGRHNLMTI